MKIILSYWFGSEIWPEHFRQYLWDSVEQQREMLGWDSKVYYGTLTALCLCSDTVCFAVLFEAQLQLMQVHWSRVDPGALQVHTDTLTPLPPSEDSYFFQKRKGEILTM